MKKAKNTEEQIKDVYTNKLQVATGSDLDKRVMANSMNALENAKSVNSANIWVTVAHSRITQVAAVFVVVSAICLFSLSDNGQLKQHNGNWSEIATQSAIPSELLSLVSLNIAFRDGDMEAVDKQFDKFEKMRNPKLKTRLTIDQLICELDGC